MRGKVGGDGLETGNVRITPAYAGKSQSRGNAVCVRKDHPRLCGEKVTVAVPLIPYSGSPPPMRGKDPHRSTFHSIQRITPAYAGKSEKCKS